MSADRCRAAKHCPDPPRPGLTTCVRHGEMRLKATREYQERHRNKGLCIYCSRKAVPGSRACERCLESYRTKERTRTGSAPWKRGGRGRPPLSGEEDRS